MNLKKNVKMFLKSPTPLSEHTAEIGIVTWPEKIFCFLFFITCMSRGFKHEYQFFKKLIGDPFLLCILKLIPKQNMGTYFSAPMSQSNMTQEDQFFKVGLQTLQTISWKNCSTTPSPATYTTWCLKIQRNHDNE